MILQLLIVLGALWVGSRYGSLALGAISGIGLALLVFGFGLKPGTPPTDVIYIIIAAVTCAGIMQASGGMDWLIQMAERLLRKHPDRITFLAPITTFFLTVLVGTGHVVYTLMPIICDIALKKGIRPERPCGVASIASQVGITCSPIAAAVVAFVSISNTNGFNITIPNVLMVSIPACLCGLIAAAAASYHRGLDLDKDPEFQKKIADPVQLSTSMVPTPPRSTKRFHSQLRMQSIFSSVHWLSSCSSPLCRMRCHPTRPCVLFKMPMPFLLTQTCPFRATSW